MSNNRDRQSPIDLSESLLSKLSNDPGWFLYDAPQPGGAFGATFEAMG